PLAIDSRHRRHRSTLFPYTTLFRSDLGLRIIPFRAADRAEQHAVGLLGGGQRLLPERDAERVDRRAADDVTPVEVERVVEALLEDRKSTRLNSSHLGISYAAFRFKN